MDMIGYPQVYFYQSSNSLLPGPNCSSALDFFLDPIYTLKASKEGSYFALMRILRHARKCCVLLASNRPTLFFLFFDRSLSLSLSFISRVSLSRSIFSIFLTPPPPLSLACALSLPLSFFLSFPFSLFLSLARACCFCRQLTISHVLIHLLTCSLSLTGKQHSLQIWAT